MTPTATNTNPARRTALIAATGLALILSACGSHTTQTTRFDGLNPHPLPTVVRAPHATLQISTPPSGSTQPHTFAAHVAITHFHRTRIALGIPPRPGYGHIDFSLDHGRYDQPQYTGATSRLAIQLGVNGLYSPTDQPQITYQHIPAGHHTLIAELVNTNGTSTGIRATVRFTVK